MFWCCGTTSLERNADRHSGSNGREVNSQRSSSNEHLIQCLASLVCIYRPDSLSVESTVGSGVTNIIRPGATHLVNHDSNTFTLDGPTINMNDRELEDAKITFTVSTMFPKDDKFPVLNRTSAKLTECSVCFDDLCKVSEYVDLDSVKFFGSICALFNEGKRACRHFFHTECVARWSSTLSSGKTCPLCRCPFLKYEAFPNIHSSPDLFFDFIDFDGNGSLSRIEIFEVLRCILPFGERQLEKIIVVEWKDWNENKDAGVSRDEFFHPEKGLLSFLTKHCTPRVNNSIIPSIFKEPLKWFQYWDDDGNRALSPQEVLRAIVKSFNISTDHDALQRIKEIITSLWTDFESDMDGMITYEEFCSPDGLRDTIVANLSI
ncbi:putative Neurocalcin-delta [Cardiosporidium cionae]|uniref:Anaphase-promoting complex subunit 11 n=1 Tax=Cardiosporidium cionae TaxID=476202 RepID=A0ABQ7JCD6_9APIC|nr:putative Neurocalcin-delta [Cardiosporidium cionae]|eukprot:KAF8821636.1 putative Neurocalcin-delta [Cardiosporidium cionae]